MASWIATCRSQNEYFWGTRIRRHTSGSVPLSGVRVTSRVTQGVILFIAFNFLVINLLADLAYALVNPRVRTG